MRAKLFVDTNIWVHAHLEDENDPRCDRAWTLINTLARPVVSPQVIAEYYNAMLRNRQEDAWIQENIEDMLLHCELQPLGRAVIVRAIEVRNRYGFSYWDCQIVAAALEAGCAIAPHEIGMEMQSDRHRGEGFFHRSRNYVWISERENWNESQIYCFSQYCLGTSIRRHQRF